MAVLDLLKRFVATAGTHAERRVDARVRPPTGARVLVVDDSATIRAVLGKVLLQDGYEVLKAADGESALAVARVQPLDLIFLDIVLPGMSGFAALRALRHDPGTQAIPIVMISGNPQATEQFYVQRFGADGFVRKPFRRADVFHAIRALVQAGRLRSRGGAPPLDVVPDGMTAEEWDAIPEIGMPDEAHARAGDAAAVAARDARDVPDAQPLIEIPTAEIPMPDAAPINAAAQAAARAGTTGPEIWRVAGFPGASSFTLVPPAVAPLHTGSPVPASATWYRPLGADAANAGAAPLPPSRALQLRAPPAAPESGPPP